MLFGRRGQRWLVIATLVLTCLTIPLCRAQTGPHVSGSVLAIDRDIDPAIAKAIAAIPAIDNHAHPVLPPPNDRTDRNFDALPVDNMEPQTDPVAWRPDNPQLIQAWKALWGFSGTTPLDGDKMKQLSA